MQVTKGALILVWNAPKAFGGPPPPRPAGGGYSALPQPDL